mmetsp:Transcript_42980/g.48802  ORF Transcript_42980/g.48802 Transcript_42980/m.48802 type:complete len:577 (+) Transcript_42980:73-1803(+)
MIRQRGDNSKKLQQQDVATTSNLDDKPPCSIPKSSSRSKLSSPTKQQQQQQRSSPTKQRLMSSASFSSSYWSHLLVGTVLGIIWRYGSIYQGVGVVNYDHCAWMKNNVVNLVGNETPKKYVRNSNSNNDNDDENGVVPILSIKTPPQFYAYQPKLSPMYASKILFTDMPATSRNLFYAHMSKMCHPMIRALREQGWKQTHNWKEARLIYAYSRGIVEAWLPELASWQRYNHIPNTRAWNHKDNFANGFRRYESLTGIRPYFVPETFDLTREKVVEKFRKKLYEENGLSRPWVLKVPNMNQGKGVFMLGPNSDGLKGVFDTIKKNEDTRYIIQQYICNEMTWNKRKFDVRVFWLVASLDPLIVLYQDGYVRIGNGEYDENDFSDNRKHLTTHTFLGEEGKATYPQLNDRILQHVEEHPHLKEKIKDPVTHVRNQFKESIGMLVDAFRGDTFVRDPPPYFEKSNLAAEDSFEFYGADCVIDNELDVWMIEAQDDTGLDEDHYFRLEMHHEIFYGMGLVLSEIWDKQSKGEPILPLKNAGKWELIYANGWRYEYDEYEREKESPTCGLKTSSSITPTED